MIKIILIILLLTSPNLKAFPFLVTGEELPPEVLVHFDGSGDPSSLLADPTMESALEKMWLSDDTLLVVFQERAEAVSFKEKAELKSMVKSVEYNQVVPLEHGFIVPQDPLFGAQYHLSNSSGIDLNVLPVWQQGIRGNTVSVAVLDDGVETAHSDLAPNTPFPSNDHLDTSGTPDFTTLDRDPNPVAIEDRHGTAVAGLIAADDNTTGGVGVAPDSTLVGVRLGFTSVITLADLVQAYGWQGENGIQVQNASFNVPPSDYPFSANSPLITQALENNQAIFVTAAGNQSLDANKSDTETEVDVITVSAVSSDGQATYFSNFGANITAAAPGIALQTTDRSGSLGYSSGDSTSFSGTSAATPVVAGVVALMSEANPALDARMLKHILARTSQRNDPTSEGRANTLYPLSNLEGSGVDLNPLFDWEVNGAGVAFNPLYGFGVPDAAAAVAMAQQIPAVTPLHQEGRLVTLAVPQQIPQFPTASTLLEVPFLIDLDSSMPLEEVMLSLDIDHASPDDLLITLVSPSGTEHLILGPSPASRVNVYNAYNSFRATAWPDQWQLKSNGFWGEDPEGIWTLRIGDLIEQNSWSDDLTGSLNSFSLDFRMGSIVTTPEPGNYFLTFVMLATLLARRRKGELLFSTQRRNVQQQRWLATG